MPEEIKDRAKWSMANNKEYAAHPLIGSIANDKQHVSYQIFETIGLSDAHETSEMRSLTASTRHEHGQCASIDITTRLHPHKAHGLVEDNIQTIAMGLALERDSKQTRSHRLRNLKRLRLVVDL